MRFIQRWGLMHNHYPENIQEHSLRVATLAHALALIGNTLYGKGFDADRAAALALYHDATEVLTGDLPAPVKYRNDAIRRAYHSIESSARDQLLQTLPEALRGAYTPYFSATEKDLKRLVKCADKLCAYLKCVEEVRAGNGEFSSALETLKREVESIDEPEVRYFLEVFAPSFALTLDDLSETRATPP
jgi:5'-deoxynucleotidase